VAGSGPEREGLASLADRLGVRLVLLPDLPWERIVERYVVADVFALLSRHEPWGVVVNEAAACGLPLVLSDRVGAAYDLLEDGRNGVRVPAGDAAAAGAALRDLAADPDRRGRAGAASRELVRGWGYEPSIESFVSVVLRVADRSGRHP
jgi:glycosyltransferase involved in cell wall biosynthesis